RALSDSRFLGGLDALAALEQTWEGQPKLASALTALRSVGSAAEQLVPVLDRQRATVKLNTLVAFLDRYECPIDSSWGSSFAGPRLARGRAAISEALVSLASAHALHDDRPMDNSELVTVVRRWIEEQTFAQEPSSRGVHLV